MKHTLIRPSLILLSIFALVPASSASARPAVVVPAGTVLPIAFETTVSSATSRVGDHVIATLREDVASHGRVAIPAGSEVRGRVIAAKPSGRVKGRARLAVLFDRVHVRGESRPLRARAIDVVAGKTTGKDVKIVGATTGAGALIGGLADGKHGAGVGALSGAAAGGAAVLFSKGQEVTLEAGTRWRLRTTSALQLG